MPPSERITMGFIGVGGQGGGHLLGGAWTYVAGGYAGRKDVQVLAVCDVWRDRRENAAKKVNDHYAEVYGKGNYKSCETYTDFRQVLDRPDIDAVLIATPAHWHATMAAMAAEAGKDIYCEKPTAVTVRESQAMLAAVRRYGRVYQAGTQQRSEYDGKFRRACEFVRSGRIGKLQAIYAYRDGGAVFWPKRFGPAKPVPEDLDWDLYLGPAPWLPYDGNTGAHRFDIGELNWGQHHYDIVQWAAAADETGPVELFMENGRSCYKYASGVVVYGKAYPGEPSATTAAPVSSAPKAASRWTATRWCPTRRTSCASRCGRTRCTSTAAPATQTTSWNASAPARSPSATRTSPTGQPARCCWAASSSS